MGSHFTATHFVDVISASVNNLPVEGAIPRRRLGRDGSVCDKFCCHPVVLFARCPCVKCAPLVDTLSNPPSRTPKTYTPPHAFVLFEFSAVFQPFRQKNKESFLLYGTEATKKGSYRIAKSQMFLFQKPGPHLFVFNERKERALLFFSSIPPRARSALPLDMMITWNKKTSQIRPPPSAFRLHTLFQFHTRCLSLL